MIQLGHGGRTLRNGTNVTVRDTQRAPLSFPMRGCREKMAACELEAGPHHTSKLPATYLTISTTEKNTCL